MSESKHLLSSIKLAFQARQVRAHSEEVQYLKSEPIAIIGMGCRFPGGADTPAAFWDVLSKGVDAISEIPRDRWDLDELFDPQQGKPGKMCTRWGGFLTSRVDEFDAEFFGISPREARRMDPQQRILLEVSLDALDDAGQTKEGLAASATGVFVSSYHNDYALLQYSDLSSIEAYTVLGSLQSIIANRLSFLLDLRGPSLVLDAACSSSLVAVHIACQSLRNEECNLALAGGVSLILSPEVSIGLSQGGFMAPDGRCRTFDAQASGFVRGEGCGMVVLKRLSDALADQDRIVAVIRGSAVNQDGHSNGFTAPSGLAQSALIRTALDTAGVSPSQISYVETHGTGTPLGDPIEVEALTEALKPHDAGPPCVLGAVKTNIGHLEAAAGIAGLIKVAMSLSREAIPPNLHFTRLNPHISFEKTRFIVPTEMRDWPRSAERRLAGVSSFGVGGTNAHVILEEAPQLPRESSPGRPFSLLVTSAHSAQALKARAQSMQAFISSQAPDAMESICWTAAKRRTHYEHRLAAAAATPRELAEQLAAFVSGEEHKGLVTNLRFPQDRPVKLAFVFPGQGSQWLGMGQTLLKREPVFRESLAKCEQALRKYVAWSLLDELGSDEATSRMSEIDVVQPMLFSIQVSLAALWMSWGVTPNAVVGHSMGEVAAAHVAGVLSLDDAARIICLRSRILRQVSGKGSMAMVDLSQDKAAHAIRGLEDRLSVAVCNSVRSTVLSGDSATLKELIDRLEKQNIFCRWIKVDVASHSPQMDPLRPELLKAMAGVNAQPATIPIYSTVTGQIADGSGFDADYWADNLRKPVLFSSAVQSLQDENHQIFLEISSHPILLPAIQQGFQQSGREGMSLPSLRRDEDEQAVMFESLGSLYTRGYPVDWNRIYAAGEGPIELPSYPWQRERFWYTDDTAAPGHVTRVRAAKSVDSDRSLLGPHWSSSIHPNLHFWELDLAARDVPFLDDYQIDEKRVFPAAAFVEMALSGMSAAFGPQDYSLESVTFVNELNLHDDAALKVQLIISGEEPHSFSFKISSQSTGDNSTPTPWTLHATGNICVGEDLPKKLTFEQTRSETITSRELIPGSRHYEAMELRALRYGPGFQSVEEFWWNDGNNEMVAKIQIPGAAVSEANVYQLHPAVLDACLQVMLSASARSADSLSETEILVPVSFERLKVRPGFVPDGDMWIHAIPRVDTGAGRATFGGDVFVEDEKGIAIEIRNAQFRTQERESLKDVENLFYKITWRPKPLLVLEKSTRSSGACSWIVFADSGGIAKSIAAQLEASGDTCLMVFAGAGYRELASGSSYVRADRLEDFQHLFSAVGVSASLPPCRGILYLWGLDSPPSGKITLAGIETANQLGSVGALHLIQSIAQTEWTSPPRLWLISSGAQRVDENDKSLSVAQCPLWGLRRVIANEHPAFDCTGVDLGHTVTEQDVYSLLDEIRSTSQETEIVFRRGTRYVARLEKWALPIRASKPELAAPVNDRPDFAIDKPSNGKASVAGEYGAGWSEGTYLITGGFGGLGLELAKWLVGQGALNVVLTGRRGASSGSQLSLAEMRKAGAHVIEARMDVSEPEEVRTLLADIKHNMPPLRGIFHAAGILDDGILSQLDQTRFRSVMAPKVAGAWNLHSLTLGSDLEMFVLFSSAAALMGSPGQGNYAAANAFMDGLAQYRHGLGMPALSVNWGPWSEVGLAAAEVSRGRRLALHGMTSFPPKVGIEALHVLLSQQEPQVAVMALNLRQWEKFYPTSVALPFFSSLRENNQAATVKDNSVEPISIRASLLAVEPGTRRRSLLEAHIQQQIGRVLKTAPSRLDLRKPLKSFGLDSLVALELRNRLEISLNLTLPATLVWNYLNIAMLATHLAERMGISLEPSSLLTEAPVGEVHQDLEDDSDLDQILDQIEQLSEEERQRRGLDRVQ